MERDAKLSPKDVGSCCSKELSALLKEITFKTSW